ncbi:MAG: MarR family transcriptional regulator [Thermomicrobiales bacterium]|nr:MarR family transcriptional regulator [Thermomicrobiales bacterium]
MTPDANNNQAARPELVERLERAIEVAAQSMRRDFLEMVRPYELTMTQFAVLFTLRERREPAKISELGEATLTPASSMTHTIDRLEHRGYIERSGDAHDRRAILVSLTSAGLQLVDEIERAHSQYFKERSAGFTDDELTLLIDLFERMQ